MYLQNSLGQAGLMSKAGPVFAIGVVLLGKVSLQGSQLLAAETRPDAFGPPAGSPTRLLVVQTGFWTADRLLPLT